MKRGFLTTLQKRDTAPKPTQAPPNLASMPRVTPELNFMQPETNFLLNTIRSFARLTGLETPDETISQEPLIMMHEPKFSTVVTTYTLYLPYRRNEVMIADTDLKALQKIAEETTWMLPSVTTNLPLSYEVTNVGEKGMGIVATRNISAGETLLSELPILCWTKGATEIIRSPDWYEDRIEQLSIESRANILSLHSSEYLSRDITLGCKIRNIFCTNAMGTSIGGRQYDAVFPIISRFNHACDPCAFVMSNGKDYTGVHDLVALKDIKKGEEITISYLPPFLNLEERQRNLSEGVWRFKCTCRLCSLGLDERKSSDKRLRILSTFSTFEKEQIRLPFHRRLQGRALETKVNEAVKAAKEEEMSLVWPTILFSGLLLDVRGKKSPWFAEAGREVERLEKWGVWEKASVQFKLYDQVRNESPEMTMGRLFLLDKVVHTS